MKRFERFVDIVIRNEGGYVFDKADPGGETKYGISKRAFPKEDIKNLTIERAKQLYLTHYYRPCKIDLIRNELLAIHVFDFAVNAGVGRAAKTLQKLIGIDQDGIIGRKTLERLNMITIYDLPGAYINARIAYYRGLKNPRFEKGWIARVEKTTKAL